MTTAHVTDDLFSLLSGDLGREETVQLARHLRGCAECQHELADLAVAHGSLLAAKRAGIEAAARHHPGFAASPDPNASLVPGPRLDAPAAIPGPNRFRRRAAAWASVAAAVILAAGGLALALRGRSHSAPVVAVATLQRLEAPSGATGSVTVRAVGEVRDMSVTTSGLPTAPSGHFYEVWLLQPRTDKMMPMGVLSPAGDGTYSITARIMAGYAAVDVSLQADDGNPAHSSTSVLRGTVTAPVTA